MNPQDYDPSQYPPMDNMSMQSSGSTYGLPYQEKEDPEVVKWQIDPEAELDKFGHEFRGEVWVDSPDDDKPGKWEKKKKAIMTDEGVDYVINHTRLLVSKIITLSNLKEDQINRIALNYRLALIKLLYHNYYPWKLEYSHMSLIVEGLSGIVFATLNKAKEGAYLDFLGRTQKYQEVHYQRPETPKKGILDFFTGR